MKSRNQREGKFIPGWCYNPAYKGGRIGLPTAQQKKRAGSNFDLKVVRNPELGKCFLRVYREGSFQ